MNTPKHLIPLRNRIIFAIDNINRTISSMTYAAQVIRENFVVYVRDAKHQIKEALGKEPPVESGFYVNTNAYWREEERSKAERDHANRLRPREMKTVFTEGPTGLPEEGFARDAEGKIVSLPRT